MLSNDRFKNNSIRLYTQAFAGVFSNITISLGSITNELNEVVEKVIKVPIQYSPKMHFIRFLQSRIALNSDKTTIRNQLPQMGFEIVSMGYDSSRQRNRLNRRSKIIPNTISPAVNNSGKLEFQYEGVPWNISFSLNVGTKTIDEAMQILEQISVVFNPHFNISLKSDFFGGNTVDIPLTMRSSNLEVDYEGSPESERIVMMNFVFDMEVFLYSGSAEGNIIKEVEVNVRDFNQAEEDNLLVQYQAEIEPETANRDDEYEIVETITNF